MLVYAAAVCSTGGVSDVWRVPRPVACVSHRRRTWGSSGYPAPGPWRTFPAPLRHATDDMHAPTAGQAGVRRSACDLSPCKVPVHELPRRQLVRPRGLGPHTAHRCVPPRSRGRPALPPAAPRPRPHTRLVSLAPRTKRPSEHTRARGWWSGAINTLGRHRACAKSDG